MRLPRKSYPGGANFFWAHFRLSLGSEMFCARVRMRKPTRITTPFQVTALVITWPQGKERVRIEGIESVRVLVQLLRGRKHHEQVSYRSKNAKYLFKCSLIFQIFCWLLACTRHFLIGLFHLTNPCPLSRSVLCRDWLDKKNLVCGLSDSKHEFISQPKP